MAFGGLRGFVTVHPSFLLRIPDENRKVEEYSAFVDDLRRIREIMKGLAAETADTRENQGFTSAA